MRRYLVQLPVGVHGQGLGARGHALNLGHQQAVAVRHLAIALEGLVPLVLGDELLQILLVRHAGRLVLGYVFNAVCPRPLLADP